MSKIFNFLLFLFFLYLIKSDTIDKNKYSFQLYSSWDQNHPYYFYAQANNELITINSTEGENSNIIERKQISEYLYKDKSSINIIDNTYLVKTCFGPNKLVEIIYKNKETYTMNNNNFNNIKFCYTTKIHNPDKTEVHPDEFVLITYWAEIERITNKIRYAHKCILFYPESKTFSQELTLTSESRFVVNIYYPEKCVTFRDTDIFCVIHYVPAEIDEIHILGNNYVIETKNIFLDAVYGKKESVKLVISNSQISSTVYQRPISLKKTSNSIYGFIDIYITEYHRNEGNGEGKVSLMYSYYRKYIYSSYIPFTSNIFIGINIEDNYVHQDLFNYLVPNEDELIIIYISKEDKMSLILNRFNASDSSSKQLNKGFKKYAFNNYIRTDICDKPKYLQSIYINSFINYNDKDKNIINSNPNDNYYKYQKDIGVLISCDKNGIEYESKRIKLPQCLNTLDEINGNDKHILKFKENENEIIFDIYNDPNFVSLRNVSIVFYKPVIFSIYVNITIKIKELPNFTNILYNYTFYSITHIKFTKTEFYNNLKLSKTFILSYRIKKNEIINGISSNIISDMCKIEVSPGEKCTVNNCLVCKDKSHCSTCESSIEGIILDKSINSETYSQCICEENKNFKKIPLTIENIGICVCKDRYVYYKDRSSCISEDSIETEPIYKNGTDDLTGIDIYDDCYQTCKKCSNFSNSDTSQYCIECKDGYKLEGINCIYNGNIPPSTIPGEEKCLEDRKIWFQLGNFKFYYIKIDKCVFISYENELFFISNKAKCLEIDIKNYIYISQCLNNGNLITDKEKYNKFLNVPEYSKIDNKILINKRVQDGDKNILFHLVNLKTNEKYSDSISHIYFENDILLDLISFKADIKRPDTISKQVEYQFYKSDDEYIYEKVTKNEINKYIIKNSKGRKLDDNDKILIEIPIDWEEDQLNKLKELNNKNINAFNTSSEFYLDVCNKYTTPDKKDIYLQERKDQYYPDELFCEDKCEFLINEVNLEEKRITCECPIKEDTSGYNNIEFIKNKKDDRFIKKFENPHYKVIGCPSLNIGKNLGFYFTFFSLLIFLILCIKRIYNLFFKKDEVQAKLRELEIKIFSNTENNENNESNENNEKNENNENKSKSEDNKSEKESQDKIKIIDIKNNDCNTINSFGSSQNKSEKDNNSTIINKVIEYSDIKNNNCKTKNSFSSSQNKLEKGNDSSVVSNKSRSSNNIDKSESKEIISNQSMEDKSVMFLKENINYNNKDNKDIEKDIQKDNVNQAQIINKSEKKPESNNENDSENKFQNININEENKSNLINDSNNWNNKSRNLIESSIISKSEENEKTENRNENKKENENKKGNKKENLKESLQKSLKKSVNQFLNINKKKNKKDENKKDDDKKDDDKKDNYENKDNKNNKNLFIEESIINIDDYNKDDNSFFKSENEGSTLKNINDLIHNITDSNINNKSSNNKDEDNSQKKGSKLIEEEINLNKENNENDEKLECIDISNLIAENNKEEKIELKNKKKREDKIANPPPKSKVEDDSNKSNSDRRSINMLNNENITIEIENKEFCCNYDNLLDRKNYEYLIEIEQNKHSYISMLKSFLKSNSTLAYLFLFTFDNNYIRWSILILCINLYVYLNASLQYDMSMVLLYDKNFNFGRFILKIFLSILIGLPIIFIKKYLSVYNLVYEMYSLYLQYNHNKKPKYSNNSINLNPNPNSNIYNENIEIIKNNISNKISYYVKSVKLRTLIYTIFGSIFLLINCIFITSYCGIYINSVVPLLLNIIINSLITLFFIFIFRLTGVDLRYFGLIKKNKSMFNASRFFNILNLTWDDFKEIIANKNKNKKVYEEKNLKKRPDDQNV